MTAGLEETYEALRGRVARRVVVRDGVVVEGPDAWSWLQGQLTQDLDGLEVGDARDTLVLSPRGKVDSAGRVWRRDDERFVLEVEAGFGEALEARLARFRLRVKASLARTALRVAESRGPGAEELRGEGAVAVDWPGFVGWDVLLEGGTEAPAGFDGHPGAFEAARIEAGLPLLGRELTEATIPQEAGDAFVARTVSFTKGCYTGQELVARLDSRGSNVPRRLCAVVCEGAELVPGDELVAGEAVAGELTSAAWSPGLGASVGLAYVRRSFATPLAVAVHRPGREARPEAEVRALPLFSG